MILQRIPARDLRDDGPVEARHVRPVDLDQVACRVTEVHLHPSRRVRADGGAIGLAVEEAHLLRLRVDGLEVVDVEGDVVVGGRRGVADEDVELLVVPELEPLDGHPEVGSRQPLRTEELFVEAYRRLHVFRVDRDVIDAGRPHVGRVCSHRVP